MNTRLRWFDRVGALASTLCLVIVVAGGCDIRGPGTGNAAAQHVPVHVDSIFPIEEELRRFRAVLPDSVTTLEGGAGSREELVQRFVAGLEAADIDALSGLRITPGEFAWLYYPWTRYTHRPYEMSPQLLWFQLENYGGRGLSRALTRYGERPLGMVGHICPEEPTVQGPNRLWEGCLVRRVVATGDTVSLSLFGAILERDSRYKFINFANRL